MSSTDTALSAWLATHLGLQDVVPGPRLGGGNSNVTQLLDYRDGRLVLRRPPDAALSASAANGVRREHRMLQALHGRARVPRWDARGGVASARVSEWCGDKAIIGPRGGGTGVVAAAGGAVGSGGGQLAKAMGCRVVGVAGGPEKCKAVVEEFGFDACIDHRGGDLRQALAQATPNGIDGYFENTGGEILDLVLARMNAFGRIAVCGLIAGYDGQPIPVNNIRAILVSRLKVQGFIISEHPQFWPPALAELGEMVASGRLRYRESVAHGLAAAPEALKGLLKGRNFGKQLVKLG